MSEIIPSGLVTELIDCWATLIDQTYDIFGENCTLNFPEGYEQSSGVVYDDTPQFNSINSRRRRLPDSYKTSDKTLTASEGSDSTVRVKIYWNAKEWKRVYGYIKVPDNEVMVLCKLSDANDINSCISMTFEDYTFTRVSKVIPYGFEKNRYGSSIWRYDK